MSQKNNEAILPTSVKNIDEFYKLQNQILGFGNQPNVSTSTKDQEKSDADPLNHTSALEQENKNLIEENKALKEKIIKLNSSIEYYKKEIDYLENIPPCNSLEYDEKFK